MAGYWLGSEAFENAKEDWVRKVRLFIENWRDSSSEIELKTSGSTGVRKSFNCLKKALSKSAINTNQFFDIQQDSVLLLCMDVDYVGAKMMVVRALESGADLYVVEPVSEPLLGVGILFDFVAMVPFQFQQSSLEDLAKCKSVILGGAQVDEVVLDRVEQLGSVDVYETFGMTETLSHFALKNLSKKESQFNVLPNVELELDERGCLKVSVPGVTQGFIQTNDVVDLVDGGFVWRARYDNVINTGGVKVFAEELESFIRNELGVEVLVFGVKDVVFGNVVALASIEELDRGLLKKKVVSEYGKYWFPKKFYRIESWIYLPNMKLDRKSIVSSILV